MHRTRSGLVASAALSFLFGDASAYHKRQNDNSTKFVVPGASSYNGLNLVPQMGWNDWNAFGCDINEEILRENARFMVEFGLRDLGYKYVVLDDCWSIGRNASGYLVEDRKSVLSLNGLNS
jgi:alpha-galactosidase